MTIPSKINGLPVTSLGDDAFYACRSLASVATPGSVANLGSRAFSYCTSLASLTLPARLTTIPYGAFSICTSLTNVVVGNTVTSIGTRPSSSAPSRLTTRSFPDRMPQTGRWGISAQ